MNYIGHLWKIDTPGGVEVALCTPKPQVRGSALELGNVDSTFLPFSGSIKLRTKHAWELNTGGPPLD